MPRALITGDAGFVGSHFFWELKKRGYSVHGVDIARENPYNRHNYPVRKDARDYFMNNNPRKGYYDLVIHCAAVVGGRKTIDGNPLALASNLALDAGLFEWSLRTRPGRVIYFSSSAAYPAALQTEQRKHRLHETDIDPSFKHYDGYLGIPDQLYGWAKLTGENLAWRARQEGLNVTVVRPFSGYGEKQANTYPFPAFIDRAKRKEDPFQIWGDGTQTRDFIHIDDIVGATMKMVDEGIDGPVNLGWGRATTMTDLAQYICNLVGYIPEYEYLGGEPSGVNYRVCDNSKMLEFYKPRVSLEEGIVRAVAYR